MAQQLIGPTFRYPDQRDLGALCGKPPGLSCKSGFKSHTMMVMNASSRSNEHATNGPKSRAKRRASRTAARGQISVPPSELSFPWVSSRTIVAGQRGRYDIDLPKECPLRVAFTEFTREHHLTPSHHDPLEMVFIVEGQGRFTVEGNEYPVAPGDWVLVGPREFHLLDAVSVGPLRLMGLYFLPDLLHPPTASPLDCEWLRPFYYRGPSFST